MFMKSRKMIMLFVSVILVMSLLSGCNSNQTASTTAPTVSTASDVTSAVTTDPKKVQTLNLTMFNQWGEPFLEPQKDVVKPAIEASGWKINVTEHSYEAGGKNWTELLNLGVAAGNLPDVFEIPGDGVDSIDKFADKFVDLTPILSDPAKVPNLTKYLNKRTLDLMKTKDSKKNLYWPTKITNDWTDPAVKAADPELYTDVKSAGNYIVVREDILTKLGFKFKPINDLETAFKADPSKRVNPDDLKLDPEIKTIADWEKFMTDVKALNLKTADGSSVIPLGGNDPEFVFGASYGFDFFRELNGKVDGFYGAPNAKEMAQTLNKWARGGLLDKNIYILGNQADKLDSYITNGKYAAWTGGNPTAITAFETASKSRVRWIPTPKFKDLEVLQDALVPGSGQGLLIRKDYKDVDKLIQYLDWLYSDEAQELIMWGSDGGVWEMKNGKKVFKDAELYDLIKSRQSNKKTSKNQDANYYGIYDTAKNFYTSSSTRGFIANGGNSKFRYEKNYPVAYDFIQEEKRIAGAQAVTESGDLLYAYGAEAGKFNNYFWSTAWGVNNGKLTLSKDDAEFEKNWNGIVAAYMKSGDYQGSMTDMQARYHVLSGK